MDMGVEIAPQGDVQEAGGEVVTLAFQAGGHELECRLPVTHLKGGERVSHMTVSSSVLEWISDKLLKELLISF